INALLEDPNSQLEMVQEQLKQKELDLEESIHEKAQLEFALQSTRQQLSKDLNSKNDSRTLLGQTKYQLKVTHQHLNQKELNLEALNQENEQLKFILSQAFKGLNLKDFALQISEPELTQVSFKSLKQPNSGNEIEFHTIYERLKQREKDLNKSERERILLKCTRDETCQQLAVETQFETEESERERGLLQSALKKISLNFQDSEREKTELRTVLNDTYAQLSKKIQTINKLNVTIDENFEQRNEDINKLNREKMLIQRKLQEMGREITLLQSNLQESEREKSLLKGTLKNFCKQLSAEMQTKARLYVIIDENLKQRNEDVQKSQKKNSELQSALQELEREKLLFQFALQESEREILLLQ
ncbi:hypothetical protein HK096_010074, partial [Nowakowskiella sp. JEL0078]